LSAHFGPTLREGRKLGQRRVGVLQLSVAREPERGRAATRLSRTGCDVKGQKRPTQKAGEALPIVLGYEYLQFAHEFCPGRHVGKQRMVLAIEWHKSGVRDGGSKTSALIERNKPVVDAVKDDCGYGHVRQQVDDVDIVDRPSQIYAGSPIGRPDAH